MTVLDYFEGSGAGFGIIIVILFCLPLGLPPHFFTHLLSCWRKGLSAHGPLSALIKQVMLPKQEGALGCLMPPPPVCPQ